VGDTHRFVDDSTQDVRRRRSIVGVTISNVGRIRGVVVVTREHCRHFRAG
jgi:hypothetical protein